MVNTKIIRAYPDDELWMRKIASKRFLDGKDKKEHKPARVIKAMRRLAESDDKLLKRLLEADFK